MTKKVYNTGMSSEGDEGGVAGYEFSLDGGEV